MSEITQIPRAVGQLVDGTVRIVRAVPGQAIRTWLMLPPGDRRFLLGKIGLGEDTAFDKVLPYAAMGIVAVVAWRIYRGLK